MTDASVIAVAERLGVTEIATIDRRHFTVVPRATSRRSRCSLSSSNLKWPHRAAAGGRCLRQPRAIVTVLDVILVDFHFFVVYFLLLLIFLLVLVIVIVPMRHRVRTRSCRGWPSCLSSQPSRCATRR